MADCCVGGPVAVEASNESPERGGMCEIANPFFGAPLIDAVCWRDVLGRELICRNWELTSIGPGAAKAV